jgi:hypothetical protein
MADQAMSSPKRAAGLVAGGYRWARRPAPAAAQEYRARDLPALFFVGPPRTATTWLHAVLQGRLSLPRLKETYFFDKLYSRGFNWYLAHFPAHEERLTRAEIAPSYFFSADARTRIHAAAGRVRIVVTLRDPVLRLHSLYKMRYANAAFRWTFEEACECDEELRTTAQCAPHLAAWQQRFGPDHVMVLLYEDLIADRQAWIERVCRFAGLPTFQLSTGQMAPVHSSETSVIPRHPAWTRLGVGVGNWIYDHEWETAVALVKRLRLRWWFLERGLRFPKLDREVEQRMRRKLVADIGALESILGRDLALWKPAL